MKTGDRPIVSDASNVAAVHGYLPIAVPLIARVAAARGQLVLRRRSYVSVHAARVTTLRHHDDASFGSQYVSRRDRRVSLVVQWR
jgi:type IV secretory pathway protease TraF